MHQGLVDQLGQPVGLEEVGQLGLQDQLVLLVPQAQQERQVRRELQVQQVLLVRPEEVGQPAQPELRDQPVEVDRPVPQVRRELREEADQRVRQE